MFLVWGLYLVVGFLGQRVCKCSALWNIYGIVFQSGYTKLHFNLQGTLASNSYQCLVWSLFKILNILVCVYGYFVIVLICISLLTNDWALFLFIGHIDNLFSEVPVQVFYALFSIGLSFFHWLVGVLYIFWLWVLCQIYIINLFSHFVTYLFYSCKGILW